MSDTLFHTGKAETTSLDETGHGIVLSEQEATEDNNKQDTTLGNPQEEPWVLKTILTNSLKLLAK